RLDAGFFVDRVQDGVFVPDWNVVSPVPGNLFHAPTFTISRTFQPRSLKALTSRAGNGYSATQLTVIGGFAGLAGTEVHFSNWNAPGPAFLGVQPTPKNIAIV